VPKRFKNVVIKKWALGKHISVLGFVSATGKTVHPSIVVECSKVKGAWVAAYADATWGADDAGYFSEGPFYDACANWLKMREPAGGLADNPRVLFFDNYRSHLDTHVLKLLRAHNVRVVTFHPHTTHLFCVLDTSVFATFKRILKSFFNDDELIISMLNIGNFIRLAWEGATELKVNAVTGTSTCAATKGFSSAGLVPFNRSTIDGVISGKHAEIAKMFKQQKAETAASGVPMVPKAKSIRLTAEEKEAILADFAKQHLEVKGHAATPYDVAKNRPAKVLSQLVTGSDYIAGLAAKAEAKDAGVAAKEARKVARMDAKAAKSAAAAAKATERDNAAKAAKAKADADKAKQAAKAANPAPAPPAATAPKAAKRARDVPDVGENPYAREFRKK